MDLAEFFAMGGYAKYVWPAYSLTLFVLIINVVLARRSLQSQLESARRRTRIAREEVS